jgi:DNA polymerase
MASAYEQLLDASIRHLEDLKRRGTRFVPVAPDALAKLKSLPRLSVPTASLQPVSRPAPTVAPRPIRPPSELLPTSSPSPTPPRAALDPAAKVEAMKDLRERALVCVKCPNLASSRKNVVFGVGDINAQLMFVGEAPGADEDMQGEPFVGAAGQLLTRIIQTMGLSRETVYIANILKCRPDMPANAPGNRKPTPEEMKTCIPYLHSQIDLIQPRVLVALGGVAVEGLLGKSGITKLRGTWQTYRGTPLMPTFHPSYLLRTMSPRDKRLVWEDMLQVMERLGMAISEKQRGFFLPRSAP